MEKTIDLLYLTMLVRPLKRFAEAAGQDLPPALIDMISQSEREILPIVEKAEALSMGEADYPPDGYHIPKGVRLQSILEQIKTRNNTSEYTMPMMSVALSDKFFASKDKSNTSNDLSTLWDKTKENINNLPHGDVMVLAENILNVLAHFAVAIPASTKATDISLYDQARTAAAIAVCLYSYNNSGENTDKGELRLIGGDFSGIQKYIYQIVSKYASRNLKGRSFYLSLLSDAVVRTLLSELSLYRANIVYNSGGCFYLLAPNTEEIRGKLANAIKLIEQKIFSAHSTRLYVAIDSIALSSAEAANCNGNRTLSKIWQELFALRDKKKSSRYANDMQDNYGAFFSPQKVDGTKRDVITGEDFVNGEKVIPFEDGTFISEINNAQIKIGQGLKSAQVIVVSDMEFDFLKGLVHIQPAQLKYHYYLASRNDINAKIGKLGDLKGHITLLMLNGENMNSDYLVDKRLARNICSLQFYGGNESNGSTFEEMCDNLGFSRLGVLRMDVDNLGSIFQGGIPEEKASMARFAALSRSFDYFFSGYLNVICQEQGIGDRSFIVYSGGDDVFIVGSWDTTIEIAKKIQSDFCRYTCFNPAFSISGGIAIVNAKYPIIAGAEESAEEEERAKSHDCCSNKKNSISFLSTPLNWQKEFTAVEELKEEITSLLYSGYLPKSFLSLVLENAADAHIKNHRVSNYAVYWQMAYNLKRMKERYKLEKTKQLIDNCIAEVCHSNGQLGGRDITTNYNMLELWALACRWAELEYRSNNN